MGSGQSVGSSGAGPLVFGEVLFDCFEDGSRKLGGAPFNVAWHLQAFGLDPLLISRVGQDEGGREIAATMEQHGMNTAGLQQDPTHATGQVLVRLINGQPEYEIAAPRAWDFITPAALDQVPSLIYHGTLALRQETSRVALTELRRQYPAPVFMDVNLREPWWQVDTTRQLMDGATWVKINDEELRLLSDPETRQASHSDLATRLMERHGLERVIVTLGAHGAFTLDRAGEKLSAPPAERVQVVDTVGAGDAFASVCILGITRQWAWDVTMQRAQQFAARLVTQRGAVIRNPEVYRHLLSAWNTTATPQQQSTDTA